MEKKLTKVERLIALIYLLKRFKYMRASQIASRLGTSERNVYRDIVALNEAFQDYVRIICTDQGYALDETIYAPPLRVVPDEYMALETAVNAMTEANPHYQLAHQALSKIQCNFKPSLFSESFDQSLAVMQPGAKDKVHPQRLQELQILLQEKCQLTFAYFSHHSRQTKEIHFEPYALVFRKNAWYLVGRDTTKDKIILLRASRIRSLQKSKKKFKVPADFSVSRYFQAQWEIFDGDTQKVELVFRGQAAWMIEEMVWHPSQTIVKSNENQIEAHFTVALSPEFNTWILGWGALCEVKAPATFRKEIQKQIQAMSAVYDLSEHDSCSEMI